MQQLYANTYAFLKKWVKRLYFVQNNVLFQTRFDPIEAYKTTDKFGAVRRVGSIEFEIGRREFISSTLLFFKKKTQFKNILGTFPKFFVHFLQNKKYKVHGKY